MVTSLLGFGSHGRDIAAIWDQTKRNNSGALGIFDDAMQGVCRPPSHSDDGFFFGSNFPAQRQLMAERFRGATPLIHRSAQVGDGCVIQAGSVIAPNVVMLTGVELGRHVHINYASTMTRCSIGDFTTVAPGVTICGDVEIGEGVFIGAGAVITNLVKIGDWATVGAGAVVLKDVEVNRTVVGVPAAPSIIDRLKRIEVEQEWRRR